MSERRKYANRAARLRRKRRAGEELSAEETEFLSTWDAHKNPAVGRPTLEEQAAKAGGVSPTQTSFPIDDAIPPPDASRAPRAVASPNPTPPLPDASQPVRGVSASDIEASAAGPPSPPAVLSGGPKAGKIADWRDKYKDAAGGRESTCLEMAYALTYGLKSMNKAILEAGAKPFISDALIDARLFPAAVLTPDKLLPPKFETGPEVTTVLTASVVTTQRWLVNSKLVAKREMTAAQKTAAEKRVFGDEPRPEPRPEPDSSQTHEPSHEPDQSAGREPGNGLHVTQADLENMTTGQLI